MFEKSIVAIDINSERISILVGHRYKIEYGVTVETPKDSFKEEKILNIKLLADSIRPYIKKGKSKVKDVAFVLRGQDIITRHLVLPMAREEAMRDTIDFELRQFIGDRVDEYYFDYEITHYDKNDSTGNAEVLIAAVEKSKVESYLELGKELGLEVKVLDIYANVIARVFRNVRQSVTKGVKTSGIINLDAESISITMMEWGRLALEKYQGYGVANSTDDNFSNNMEYNAFLDRLDLIEVKEELDKTDRFFQDTVSQYNSLIQYFTAGKVKKNLDRIYVVGTATRIKGVEQYFEVNLNAKAGKPITFTDLKSSVKYPKKIQLKDYIFPYGLLLRRE